MAKLSIVAGTTSKQLLLFIQDSSSTTGAGRSGLAFNTTGLSATYAFAGALPVTITFATLTATTAAFSSGGFIEMNASIMTGWYRFDPPNAMLAGSGTSGQVGLHLFGAASMAPLPVEIELTGWDNQKAFPNQTIAAITAPVTIVQSPVTVVAISAGILGSQTIAAVAAPVTVGAMTAGISGNQTVAAVAAPVSIGAIGAVTVAVMSVPVSVNAMSANIMANQTIAAVAAPVTVGAMTADISGNQTVAAVAASIGVTVGNVTVGAVIAGVMGTQTIAAVAAPVTVGTLSAGIMGNQTIAVVAGSVGAVGAVVPANIVQVNSITVNGAGTSVSPWGP
jgi:hypothetical protein